jgi:hypothetical protein
MNGKISGCPDCGSQSILHRAHCKIHLTIIIHQSKKEEISSKLKKTRV